VTKNSAGTTTDRAQGAKSERETLMGKKPGGTSRGAAYMCIFAGTAALLSEYPFVGIMFLIAAFGLWAWGRHLDRTMND
jgi:hypothetical protein